MVKDSSVQSSLQEIIAAQKLQAAYVHSQTQLLSLSSPLQSQSGTLASSQGQGSYRGVSSSSSSFFAGSHFVPHMQAGQTSSSSNGPRVKDCVVQSSGAADRVFSGVTVNLSAGGPGTITETEDDTIRISLDEDQKSDNTTPAGESPNEWVDKIHTSNMLCAEVSAANLVNYTVYSPSCTLSHRLHVGGDRESCICESILRFCSSSTGVHEVGS